MNNQIRRIVTPTIAAFLSTAAAEAALMPYVENFDTYDNIANTNVVPAGFNESPGSAWSIQNDAPGKDYENRRADQNNTVSTINASLLSAVIPVTNVVGASFIMSAELVIDEAITIGDARNDIETGILALGIGGFSPGYKGAIDLANTNIGRISIQENGALRASAFFPVPLAAGTPYLLTLQGIYNGVSNLTLTFTLAGGASTASVSYADTSPQNGPNFGFESILRTYPGGTTAAIDADYDNLSVLPLSTTPVLVPAVLAGIAWSNETAWLHVTNLTAGATNRLLHATQLTPAIWTTQAAFIATGLATNWTIALPADLGFFAIQSAR